MEMSQETKDLLYRQLFGKSLSEMSKEEILLAITSLSNRMYGKTGDKKYKDMEDAFMLVFDDLNKGVSDISAVEDAVNMLKGRGYIESEEDVDS